MPMYRVLINNQPVGDYITASSPQDAYFDVASTVPLKYTDTVQFEEIKEASLAISMLEQDLRLGGSEKPNGLQ